eukprot:scaffold2911_cov414-Prasinococcus_capsulatus_cf.AAC.26
MRLHAIETLNLVFCCQDLRASPKVFGTHDGNERSQTLPSLHLRDGEYVRASVGIAFVAPPSSWHVGDLVLA